ncbi:MAG: Hsp20/alpha crystallin family protein [Bacteroidales bacterium]
MTIARLSDNLYPSFPSLMNRFFEGDLMDWSNSNFAGTNSTLPAVNIMENNDEFLIDVAAPGMKKEQIKVDYENGCLTISSEMKEEKKEKSKGKYTRREFSYMSFQRAFSIPENLVDGDKIQATYNEGILHINLPKREEIRPKPARQIQIN